MTFRWRDKDAGQIALPIRNIYERELCQHTWQFSLIVRMASLYQDGTRFLSSHVLQIHDLAFSRLTLLGFQIPVAGCSMLLMQRLTAELFSRRILIPFRNPLFFLQVADII